MLRGVDNQIHHGRGGLHIHYGGLKKLSRVTTDNVVFTALAVSQKGRHGYTSEKDEAIHQADKYFQVDSRNHYFMNHFRPKAWEKYRLGTDYNALKHSIVAEAKHIQTESSENKTLLTGLNYCRTALREMVTQDGKATKKKDDVKVLLLAETLARQLNEIGTRQSRELAGEEVTRTLTWIDTLLASNELERIGMGGKLKEERIEFERNKSANLKSLAYSVPVIASEHLAITQDNKEAKKQPSFNETLQKIRDILIETEVEMALESCMTEADQRWSNIYATIQGMDRQIAEIHGQRVPEKLVSGSNLDMSSDTISNICIETKDKFTEGIEPILTELNLRADWSDTIASASGELEGLCADLPRCTAEEQRTAWIKRLDTWANQYDKVLLPNGQGCLGEILTTKLEPALKALTALAAEDKARGEQGFAVRQLPWLDKALATLDLCSASLLSPNGALDKYKPMLPEKDPIKKYYGKVKDYNKHVAIENGSIKDGFSRRLNEFNRKNQERSRTTTANIASTGLKGHNDYIAHLKEHIREDGTKILLDRGYDTLIGSVEQARSCVKRLCRHLDYTKGGGALYEKIESLDKSVLETLEKQRQFTGMLLLSRHREILRSLYVPHMLTYARFDHPSYEHLKNKIQETASSKRFQTEVAKNIQEHGKPLPFVRLSSWRVSLFSPLLPRVANN